MAAIFIAAILVVGTFAITTTVTPQSTAFAYMKKGPQDNKKYGTMEKVTITPIQLQFRNANKQLHRVDLITIKDKNAKT
jgi:hypothetical protein